MKRGPEQARVWRYRVDTDGNLWHDGSVFDDPQILKFFLRRMERLPDGRYFALCQGEECYFEPDDAIYVVQAVEARFNRKPYLELAHLIDYDATAHRYFLRLAGQQFPIQGV
ncbi:MAG: hypothetical protein K8R69_00615 [Deltaproteobacteria bacterium]|nr:hypothetical protein [Deltaproteobacteria bacterium]